MPETWTERRAAGIRDPVARLRYLRQAAGLSRRARRRWPIAVLASAALFLTNPSPAGAPILPATVMASTTAAESVWRVESRSGSELYSNGLTIHTERTVSSRPRTHRPRGIVYHTSESQIEEFAAGNTRRLSLLGDGLLDYVARERSYHYAIDRFGRVSRIVAEGDVAFHAGNSAWADDSQEYVGLNEWFLGVVFETETRPGDEAAVVTPAQTHAARVLTELLRARYSIATGNCVTHAQVSVNPSNFRVGWHTDWAANFPFEQIGLPDNYALPVAAIAHFGFGYDPVFFASTGTKLWAGVVAAEDQVRAEALRLGLSSAALKQKLRARYSQLTQTQTTRTP